MVLKLLFLLVFVYAFCISTSDDLKGSLTFVIDDTPSMADDIDEVKRRVNDIFDAVFESKDSNIENFVLVTFNSPGVILWTVTRDRDLFKEKLAKIRVGRGDKCPASSMSGIELGLQESLPGSYLYVFTDASARDYTLHDRVKSLAQSKSSQVVFALTGMCGSSSDPDYNVFNTLAKATNGQVFHLGKVDVGDLLSYVVESVKGGRNIVTTKEFSPGYGHNFTFSVDNAIHDITLSISGEKPKVSIKDDKGFSPKTEHLVDKDKIEILKLANPCPGNYTAEVGSETSTSVVVSAKTTLNFQHGFSTFKPTSLYDTATRPLPDVKSFLMIKLNEGKNESVIVKLKTVKIVNMNETVDKELSLEMVDEKEKLYVTEPFESPKTMFKIMITGIDIKTNTSIIRTGLTFIEPQNPALEINKSKAPTISIPEEPKINVEYDEPFVLKCKVNAYPKPDIIWEDKSTGASLLTKVLDVELPYTYIGIVNIEKVNKNSTYECIASNAYGTIKKSIEIETKRKIYYNALHVPKDTVIDYKGNGKITCKIDAYPAVIITWYKNETELHSDDDFVISDDGAELIIPKMQPNQRGFYKCLAKNEYNEIIYNFKVNISGAEPPKIDKFLSKMNVTRGTDVDILCRIIQGIPEPKIVWFYKKKGMKKFEKLKNTEQNLHINNINDDKSGFYKCQAINDMGTDIHHVDLTVQYRPSVKDKDEIITAKDGEEVTLACEVNGIPTPSVEWFKNGIAIEISPLMHLYRDHSLRLKVSLDDGGLYSCNAKNHLGIAKKSIQLNVNAQDKEPNNISIQGEPKINVEYDEPFVLKCEVNAYPKPDITWEDKSTGTILLTKVLDVELPYTYIGIFNIEKVNKNSTYECIASNAYGTIKKRIEIETKRKIYYNALHVPKDTVIDYKGNEKITCKIDAYPPVIITWYKNKEELHSDDDFLISDDGAELIIPNMQPYQRGFYKCLAKNEYNEIVYNFNINISGVEPPIVEKLVHEMYVTRGTDVDISCRIIQGIPKPKIVWFFKKTGIKKFVKLKNTGEYLLMKHINDNNNGLYKCQAISVMGTDSNYIDLTVEYPPKMKYNNEVIRAQYGEQVTLVCEVNGIPTPSVQWLKNGKAIEITPLMHLYRDHSLRFKVSPKDGGLYICHAANYLGRAMRSIKLEVYAPVTIDPPKVSTIEVKVGGRAHLPCRARGNPKPLIKWIHSIDPRKPSKIIRVKRADLSLSHIQLNMAGDYTCIASNIASSYNISYHVRVLAPPIIENVYLDKTFKVVEGDLLLRIACRATGSPEPVITWKIHGLSIALGTEWYDKDADGALIIKNIDTKSGGTYTCEAVNSLGRDTEVYTVEVAPYPKQESPKTTHLVEKGTSANIECYVPHGPLDLLRWYKDNKLITSGDLKLRNVEMSDAGLYTCRVSTFSGSATGHTLVKVGLKPVFTSHVDEVYDLEDETWSQTFTCDANAIPPPKVTWWHNGEKINVTSMIYTFQSKFNKRGKYYCEVSNDFGSINRSFYLKTTDCIIDIKNDLTGNQPIMIDLPLKWPQFETTDGYIRIPREEYLRLSCPAAFSILPKNFTNAFCESESNFQISGISYKYSDLKCTEEIKPEVIETGEECYYGETEWIIIGFTIFSNFLSVYNVCLDRKNKVPIYTKHIIDRYLAEVEPESSNLITGGLPFNFEEMYDCNYQTNSIFSELGREFLNKDECCFTKRQLVNPRDVPPGLAQMATYNYLNVVPQWSSCGTKNWEEVENRLRTFVKTIDHSLTVWTGTSKTLEIPNLDYLMTEIFISDSTDESQPVSQYLWKVVQDQVKKSSLAIIQVNVPDLSPTEVYKYILCNDICQEVPWMMNPDWHDVNKGYTYCCSLEEFKSVFKTSRIFYYGHNRILY